MQAARQLTAATYGTVLTLAALVALPTGSAESVEALLVIAGLAISTFVAHLFSEFVGSQLDIDHADSAGGHRDGASSLPLLRSSLPILGATAGPMVILSAAALDLVGPTAALFAAQLYCLGRIALTGFFVTRYRGEPATGATWLAGLVLAATGAVVVVVEVLLGH